MLMIFFFQGAPDWLGPWSAGVSAEMALFSLAVWSSTPVERWMGKAAEAA